MFDVANGARRAQKTQKSKLEIRKFETNSNDQKKSKNQTKADALFATVSGFMDFIRV
jgi:hypothetical protein